MNTAALGLTLDLIGVLLLGGDLWHLQYRLRKEAQARLDAVHEILDNHENTEGWLAGIAKEADWREGTWEEGRYERYGESFDHRAAQESFSSLAETVACLATDLKVLAETLSASVKSDRETANRSIWITLLGLFLICIGFILQGISSFGYEIDFVMGIIRTPA